jgi:uncharacterized glyoxalase superfamily protein PhnB
MAPTFNAVGMAVADMAKTIDFYRGLGLDFPAGAETEGHVEATAGGIRLMFDTHEVIKSFDPGFTPGDVGGPSLAFLCAGPAEVDSVFATVVAAGAKAEMPPWDAPWGQRYAVLKDLDGYQIDLFAPLT